MRRALLAAVVALAGVVIWAAPAHAFCIDVPPDGTHPPVFGQGANEHRILEDDIYIPAHEADCPQSVGAVTYDTVPEPTAILAFQNRTTMWISINGALSASEYAIAVGSRSSPGVNATTFHQLPQFLQGFAVVTNVTAVSGCSAPGGVKLSPKTLARIYSGLIATWNNADIVADNPGMTGCNERISVAVRDGAAFSNYVLKDYMSNDLPLFAAYTQRELLAMWPGSLDISCRGFSDSGMATCAGNAGAISYMPYRTAVDSGLQLAQIKNGSGAYTPPAASTTTRWPENCQSALPAFRNTTLDYSTFKVTYQASGYGLCGLNFVVAFVNMTGANTKWNRAQAIHLKDHLLLMVNDTNQDLLSDYGWAPLPPSFRTSVRGSVNLISTG